jgi:hypothetical protein
VALQKLICPINRLVQFLNRMSAVGASQGELAAHPTEHPPEGRLRCRWSLTVYLSSVGDRNCVWRDRVDKVCLRRDGGNRTEIENHSLRRHRTVYAQAVRFGSVLEKRIV